MNLRDHLQSIYDQRGQLTPALVVDRARDPKHPLHVEFEWDDTVAGEAWRREQARHLIKSVRISYKVDPGGDKRSVRAFQAVPSPATPSGYNYEPTEAVAQDPIVRELVLREMRRDWLRLKRRYAEFDEFWRLVQTDVEMSA